MDIQEKGSRGNSQFCSLLRMGRRVVDLIYCVYGDKLIIDIQEFI